MRKLMTAAALSVLAQAALAETLVVTPADNGKTFALAVGQCIDVRLSTNPSTGYDWYMAPGLNEAMNLSARTVTTPGGAPPGAPSQLDYVLCAAAPGTVAVKFVYLRPWEEKTPPAETLAFTVKIAK